EPEGGINGFIHDGEIQAVAFGDHRPIVDSGAPERVDAQLELCATDRFQVDDACEIVDIWVQVVILVCGGSLKRFREGHSLHAGQTALEKFVCLGVNPTGDV